MKKISKQNLNNLNNIFGKLIFFLSVENKAEENETSLINYTKFI